MDYWMFKGGKGIFVFQNVLGFWIQNFVFAKQVLYYVNHTSSPFHSGYVFFGDRVSLLAQANLDFNPPILGFLLPLWWQVSTDMSSFFPLRWVPANCFDWTGLEPDSPDCKLPCSLGWQACTIVPSHWLWWGLTNFLPWLALTSCPPDISSSSSWDYMSL
jgi:hypothetical protein